MRGPAGWVRRVVTGHPRTFVALLVGLASAALLPARLAAQTRGILAWDAAALMFLGLAVWGFSAEHSSRMAADARRQQEGEWSVFSVTVAAAVASFAAIVSEFSGTKDLPPARRDLHVAVVAATLLLSWLVTHAVFAYRYAHEYYTSSGTRPGEAAKPDGGLEFPGDDAPDYWDFAYFSLVLGMTFQVSDVQITSRKMRRLALLHGFLSFAFNTVIVALTVNIAAGLL